MPLPTGEPMRRLKKLAADWRQRAGDPPAGWTVGLLPPCCREEINSCADDLEHEIRELADILTAEAK